MIKKLIFCFLFFVFLNLLSCGKKEEVKNIDLSEPAKKAESEILPALKEKVLLLLTPSPIPDISSLFFYLPKKAKFIKVISHGPFLRTAMIIQLLKVDKFVRGNDRMYDSIRKMRAKIKKATD